MLTTWECLISLDGNDTSVTINDESFESDLGDV